VSGEIARNIRARKKRVYVKRHRHVEPVDSEAIIPGETSQHPEVKSLHELDEKCSFSVKIYANSVCSLCRVCDKRIYSTRSLKKNLRVTDDIKGLF
jgi:hypothetical protein